MPLRTNIASSISVPQSRSNPLTTLRGIQDMQEQRSLDDSRRQQTEIRRRAMEDQDTVRRVMSSHPNPDQGVDELFQMGMVEYANDITKDLGAARQARADLESKKVTNAKAALDFAAHGIESLGDNPNQGEYDTWYQATTKVLPENLIALIPKQYDKDKSQRMMAWATQQSELARSTQQAIDNANKANEIQNANAKSWDERLANKEKSRAYWTMAAATALGSSPNQQDWDSKQRNLLEHGADPQDLAPFGRVWSDQAVARAQQLGKTPVQQEASDRNVFIDARAEEANARAGRADIRAQHADRRAEDAAKREAAAPRTLGGLTANAADDIEAHKDRQYEEFAKEQRTPIQGVRPDAPTDVPTIEGESAASRAARVEAAQGEDEKKRISRAETKLGFENRARERLHQPSLEQQEAIYSAPGYEAKLRKLREIYHKITEGGEMPIERMEKLAAKIRAEKDPAKAKELREQLRKLRAQQDGD